MNPFDYSWNLLKFKRAWPSLLVKTSFKMLGNPLKNNDGAVLVIALMLLAVLTILGVASLNTTTTEIRISGNEKVYKEAFYNAEAGVAYAVQSGVTIFPSAALNVVNSVVTPADLAAVSPGTVLQYIDRGGSPRRVEVWSTANTPGGGTTQIIAGIVGVVGGYQAGGGIGEGEQYAH